MREGEEVDSLTHVVQKSKEGSQSSITEREGRKATPVKNFMNEAAEVSEKTGRDTLQVTKIIPSPN